VGNVAEAVGGGGEPGCLAEDVGDTLGFDLGSAATAHPTRTRGSCGDPEASAVFGAVVQGSVGEFVGESFGGLGG
jgi:hypothetical protein